MSRLDRLSDRHRRAVDGLGEQPDQGIAVRLTARNLASVADQHTLVCLANLVCRLTGSVRAVYIAADDQVLDVVLPHRPTACSAIDAVTSMSSWANGGAIPFTVDFETPADFTVAIGGTDELAGKGVNIFGNGWIAWAGTDPSPDRDGPKEEANPIGPYFAACIGAAEIFKYSRGLKKGRFAENEALSLWDGQTGPVSELTQGPNVALSAIPPFILVGAGAVGQGLLLALGAVRPADAFAVTIDFDHHEDTNLNRCFLAGECDENYPKVEVVTRFRRMCGLAGLEFPRTLTEFAASPPLAKLPDELAAAIAADRFPLIVSAVDRNDSRWDIQGLMPDLALGGSTNHLTANAATYMPGLGRCLACYNPREADATRFSDLEKQLRSMSEDERRAFLTGKLSERDIGAVTDHLATTPRCGTVGEQVLKHFAKSSTTEFSASFVSMAAAVMLLARLIQSTTHASVAMRRGQFSSFNFRNLESGDYELCREPDCPHCRI